MAAFKKETGKTKEAAILHGGSETRKSRSGWRTSFDKLPTSSLSFRSDGLDDARQIKWNTDDKANALMAQRTTSSQ
ncbi:hypothetical protein OUZ56_020209 [Daphnia magna]|uniref:Uncharacterized protein n=1 Tax=Daphnia magna TaxID=35525 RepID=A0ABQ9ZDV0_9CRUS|nr:hypothetical protein OUZ56_020209 [Daphnia magna]